MALLSIRPFEYFEPADLQEATSLLAKRRGSIKILAGGTDVVPLLKAREIRPDCIMDISRIVDLDYITTNGDGLRIGALTTHRTLEKSPLIMEKAPVLAEAVKTIGNVQIRNLGTIGGNLANASPCADTAPALIVSRANVKVVNSEMERLFPVEDFFKFVNETVLRENDLLTEIQIPSWSPNTVGSFIKLGRRVGHDLSIASVAVAISLDGGSCEAIKIAMGSVAPTPLRLNKTETFLIGKRLDDTTLSQASELAATEVRPISDVRASAEYRKIASKVLVQRAIKTAIGRFK